MFHELAAVAELPLSIKGGLSSITHKSYRVFVYNFYNSVRPLGLQKVHALQALICKQQGQNSLQMNRLHLLVPEILLSEMYQMY